MSGNKICVKCENPATQCGADPTKAWYCDDDFIQMVKNKFRTALSKRKIYKDQDSRKTLIVLDGSASSIFLLHQIDDALRQVNFKRLMIEPTIVFLLYTSNDDEIERLTSSIKKLQSVLPNSVRWITVHVAYCMTETFEQNDETAENCYGTILIQEYEELLNSCTNDTYKKELCRILKEKCLGNICKLMNISKIMIADESDTLARVALSQMCLARGGATSTITSVLDKRQNYSIIRPLRDISEKEIEVVNKLCNFGEDFLQANTSNSQSLQSITDAFIAELENAKFYSTVNTVLSTVGKIHSTDEGKALPMCKLCEIEAQNDSLNYFLCGTCEAIYEQCKSSRIEMFAN